MCEMSAAFSEKAFVLIKIREFSNYISDFKFRFCRQIKIKLSQLTRGETQLIKNIQLYNLQEKKIKCITLAMNIG